MKSILPAAVAFFVTVVLLDGTTAAIGLGIKRDISELTNIERLLFRLTHPEVYNSLIPTSGSKSPGVNYDYTLFDFFNIDFPIAALQLSKSGSILLPSIHLDYGFYYCWGVCFGFLQQYDFSEPIVRNANLTSLSTRINSTNLEIEFKTQDFQIIMDKFTLADSDLVTNDVTFWRGLSIFVRDFSRTMSANLEFVPDVGLQIFNTTMGGGVGELRFRVDNGTHTFPDGTTEEWGEVERDYTADLNDGFESSGDDFAAFTETWLNCFLSEGRNGNEECEELLNDKGQRDNFVILLEAIGLGIAHDESQKEIGKESYEENTSHLPLLLPQFPFPSMKSTILDLPTLLLQLGKIFDPESSHIQISLLPMAYDFVRKSCGLGVCHNIRELMTLPEYGIGGLGDNRIQIDIQPTKFDISLKVPGVFFDSERFYHETTDLDSGFREMYQGLNLTVLNSGFAISGDYELKEGVGLQISNLGLTLRLGELQMKFPEYFTIDNGQTSEMQELKIDIAPEIMKRWAEVDESGLSFERRYEQYVQNLINNGLNGSKLRR